ncbi:Hypothetical predicted protein [Mytilus galloprovincialis]|uniref:Uncharacterized protein n=1 Tax=Mytilus galloprovincialis TaxID=29158 RepID=A0A8B6FUA6_MYTGA|nr:Hypothetical predicted protein [Mytilus galloprovincialis]
MADQTNIISCPAKLPRLRKTKYSVAEGNFIQEEARGGPPSKPSQFEAVIDYMKDSSSFTGIDGELETDIFVSGKHNTSHSDDDLFTTPLASPTTDTIAETPSPTPSAVAGFVQITLPSTPVSTKTVVESSRVLITSSREMSR